MAKLVFGRNGQVHFDSVEELDIAVAYIKNNLGGNVSFVHEKNYEQGAWGPEDRIHFISEYGVPECLKRIMTAGNGSIYGRINCKEFVDYIKSH